MPLPAPNTPWPPKPMTIPTQDWAAWSAWWSGDTAALTAVYTGGQSQTAQSSWEARGGLVGAMQRFFWGQQSRPGEQRSKLHLPVASEIAQVSADLLFGEPPKITVEDKPTQEVLGRLMGEALHTLLHESAEAGSALGHSWLRVGIDKRVDPTGPITSHVDADAAFPRYAYGRLQEVMFLSEFIQDGGVVWRHLENHAPGRVEHALYLGDASGLGRPMPLTEHPATEALARSMRLLSNGATGVATGLTGLDVVGVSNARTRTWRKIPEAKDLGRADISGVEPELDALDDTWSSWMRDVRHGRSRIHLPQYMLQSAGPGQGAVADIDRELYVGVNAPPGQAAAGGLPMTATQFKIRWQEHEATTAALLERIFSGAGYSPQTFGVADVAALTAMESWSRQVRTKNTRAAKIRRWRQGILQLAAIVLEYDRLHFNGRGRPDLPLDVHFQESVSESQLARAQTAQLLSAARAASIDTLVLLQHPDWDETRRQEEVRLIKAEDAAATATIRDPLDGFTDLENTPAADPPEDPDDDDPADDGPTERVGTGDPDQDTPARRRRTRGGVPA